MSGNISAKEIGQRCRRFRQLKGMSQQKLAEKVGTTAQNISKYENEGIHGIEMIQSISDILGHDLLKNERDEEGNVGEIGKEILSILIDHKGFCDTEYILEDCLYGLNKKEGLHELFKLASIGMCVREEYTGYRNEQIDRIFITAKGLITAKHLNICKKDMDISEVNTYEQICEEFSSCQEIIDNNPIQRKIRNLNCPNDLFWGNLYSHIQAYYQEGLDKDIVSYSGLAPMVAQTCENAYLNIMCCMIMGLDAEEYEKLEKLYQDYDYSYYEDLDEKLGICDTIEDGISKALSMIDGFSAELCTQIHDDIIERRINKKYPDRTVYEEKRNFIRDQFFEGDFLESDFWECNRFYELAEKKENMCVSEWFTKEETLDFINRSMVPPKNIEEERKRNDLIEIMNCIPKIKDSYFRFSKEWEENGIADFVRSKYQVHCDEEPKEIYAGN